MTAPDPIGTPILDPIVSFTAEATELAAVGGKAVNLIRMTAAGLPVPPGFVVDTSAYLAHVRRTGLDAVIAEQLAGVHEHDAPSLERADAAVRAAFARTSLDPALAARLDAAYDALVDGLTPASVAVRSSATAEDLPDLSFAGQQDTFLSVVGHEQLHTAVIGCWSSLWTARAIGYRLRAGIAEDDVALAVIVQAMVPAEVSGVLFTANPLTGVRTETVIDATYGLGEALVSGQVDPDHVEIDSRTGRVLRRTTGSKAVVIRGRAQGGLERTERATEEDALTDAQVAALVSLGAQVQREYGTPQDIEWAIVAERPEQPYLLQTRAITSLYPLPEPPDADPDLPVWLSFGAIQGMLAPMTPIGQDTIRLVAAGASEIFGAQLDHRTLPVIVPSAERLWVRIDRVLRTRAGRRLAPVFLGQVEPSLQAGVLGLLDDPRLAPRRMGRQTRRRLLRFVGVVARHVPGTLARPDAAQRRLVTVSDKYVARVQAQADAASSVPDPLQRLECRAQLGATAVRGGIPIVGPRFGPMLVPGMVLFNALGPIAGLPRLDPLTLEVTRSLPGNPTTEMDLALWDAARAIRADADARANVLAADADTLAAQYLARSLPPVAQRAVARFLNDYGFRGVGEIDLGRPRWHDEPHDVLATLARYVSLDDGATTPDEVFRRGTVAAADAIETLAAKAREQRGGTLRAHAVGAAAARVRTLLSARERPKFMMVRVFGILRRALVASGADLVAAGVLDTADDVVFLHLHELSELAAGRQRDWRELVRVRRAAYEREQRRTLVPRVIVGDGRTLYEGMATPDGVDDAQHLVGSPVSPGVAEGVVRVVFDPRTTRLEPGEVLVCPGTDPAWTPLFLTASALVTEVGGMMTHGSVVAREYGIPAVVGVHDATGRLTTGQRVRIDGSAGTITLLDV